MRNEKFYTVSFDPNDFTEEEQKLLKKYNGKLSLLNCNIVDDCIVTTKEQDKMNNLVRKLMDKGYLDGIWNNEEVKESLPKREGRPDYFTFIHDPLFEKAINDIPESDCFDKIVVQAVYTYIDYDLKNGGVLYPITFEDIATLLAQENEWESEEDYEEFLQDIKDSLLKIIKWDNQHGNPILNGVLVIDEDIE